MDPRTQADIPFPAQLLLFRFAPKSGRSGGVCAVLETASRVAAKLINTVVTERLLSVPVMQA